MVNPFKSATLILYKLYKFSLACPSPHSKKMLCWTKNTKLAPQKGKNMVKNCKLSDTNINYPVCTYKSENVAQSHQNFAGCISVCP